MKTDLSKFDAFQKDIILENSGNDIVVSASAGAGKTMVLVSRILKRCMDDRVNLDRILALTFTAAAAEEMKNRLSRELHNLLKGKPSAEEADYINRQISLLVNADITTIDAYCLTIIQRYCAVIGLDPATAENILSEGKNEAVQQEAFRQVLSETAETDFDQILLLCEYFSARPGDYQNLYDTVKKINTHAQSAVNPHEFYENCRSSYRQFKTLKQLPAQIRTEWFDLLRQECETALKNALAIKQALEEEPDKRLKPEMLIQSINLLQHCLACVNEEDYDGYLVLLKEAAVNKIPKPASPAVNLLREAMHGAIDHLLAISYEQESFARNSHIHQSVVNSLIALCENTAVRFRALKQQIPAMDFSDMERYALEILNANGGRIAKRLNHSFDEIMIDEFQDTSFLQDTILCTIAKADRSVPVFRVGDVKQSIYRFRQAKPELMRGLMRGAQGTKVFNMRYNYRSDLGVVDFTNLLFERIMNIPGGSDVYASADHVDVGTEGQRVTGDEPAVQLYLLVPPEDENGEPLKLSSKETKSYKASFISEKICEMIAASNGSLRFSDFAVLSRSHADQIVLRSSFDRYRIPYDIDAREGFYSSDLCRDILNIAKVMRDPYDEIALCAAVTSPLFSLSDEKLSAAKKGGGFAEGIYGAYPAIAETFEHYRSIMRENGLEALLGAIANTLVDHPLHAEKITFYDALPRKDQANFDYLFSLCVSAELGSLSALIREMELGEAENSSEAITTGKGDDVVTVTTIHHSKGLQYKIVFLWGTGNNRFSDKAEAVLIDDDLGLGIRDIDLDYRIALPTVQRLAVQRRIDKEDRDEFIRVLYVAITRARKQLIIVDSEDAAEDYSPFIDEGITAKRKGITGLITAALAHDQQINENGLFKVIHTEHSPNPDRYLYLSAHLRNRKAQSLPRLSFEPEILPEIRTPSSLEKSRSQNLSDGEKPVLPLFTFKNTGGSSYGTLMHKACEDMPDDREWTMELIRRVADPSLPEKAINDLYAFGHSELYQRCRSMQIHKEYPFYYESAQARINGTIDFAAVSPKKIIVIDFKTDRLTPEEIAEEYSPQLNTYKDVMQSFYPDADIELYAWSFYNGLAVPIEKNS